MDLQSLEEQLAAIDALSEKPNVEISMEGATIVATRTSTKLGAWDDEEGDVAYQSSGPGGTLLSLNLADAGYTEAEVEDRSKLELNRHRVGTLAPVKVYLVDATIKYVIDEDYPLEVRHEHIGRTLEAKERDQLLANVPGKTTVPYLALVTAKSGFEYDRASIPEKLMSIINKDQLGNVPALFHDLLYRYGGRLPNDQVTPYTQFTRKEADVLFDYLMWQNGVDDWRRIAAFVMVRCFAGPFWQE